jgi:hypothetical protein
MGGRLEPTPDAGGTKPVAGLTADKKRVQTKSRRPGNSSFPLLHLFPARASALSPPSLFPALLEPKHEGPEHERGEYIRPLRVTKSLKRPVQRGGTWLIVPLVNRRGQGIGVGFRWTEYVTRYTVFRPLRKTSYAQLHGIRNINRAHPESDYAPADFSHEPQVEVESSRGKFRLA